VERAAVSLVPRQRMGHLRQARPVEDAGRDVPGPLGQAARRFRARRGHRLLRGPEKGRGESQAAPGRSGHPGHPAFHRRLRPSLLPARA